MATYDVTLPMALVVAVKGVASEAEAFQIAESLRHNMVAAHDGLMGSFYRELRAETLHLVAVEKPEGLTFCVDGRETVFEDSPLAGDGKFGPFLVFDIPAQDYLPGTYQTRAEAQRVADYLNDRERA